jgi:hypothetical protein
MEDFRSKLIAEWQAVMIQPNVRKARRLFENCEKITEFSPTRAS